MIQHIVPVVQNVQLAERTYRLRLADAEIGSRILPGQFVMLRIPNCTEPLLGRPFALWDTSLDSAGAVAGYDIVHLVVGKMTARLSELASGSRVEVWGPLGNGFAPRPTRHLLMVGGGIGHTPFPAVARAYLGLRQYGARSDVRGQRSEVRDQRSEIRDQRSEIRDQRTEGRDQNSATPHRSPLAAPGTEYSVLSTEYSVLSTQNVPLAQRVTLCYGVRSAAFLAGVEEFRALGVAVAISTDDGSAGHHGFVTDLVKQALAGNDPPTHLVGCGPEPMMAALAKIAGSAGVPCELSLETPMACGIGACFSCVAKIRQDDGRWDYRRVCVEGPVFDASRVVFEH